MDADFGRIEPPRREEHEEARGNRAADERQWTVMGPGMRDGGCAIASAARRQPDAGYGMAGGSRVSSRSRKTFFARAANGRPGSAFDLRRGRNDSAMFSQQTMFLFSNPAHAGTLEDATHYGVAGSPGDGPSMEFWLRVEGET